MAHNMIWKGEPVEVSAVPMGYSVTAKNWSFTASVVGGVAMAGGQSSTVKISSIEGILDQDALQVMEKYFDEIGLN